MLTIMAKPQQVGLTGGIGSGKSVVAALFKLMGAPVYHADSRAKSLLNEDESLKAKVQDTFGKDTYRADRTLNRQVLADRAFADEASIQKLNALVHPAVRADYQHWLTTITSPYVVHEAALIFEADLHHQFDTLISVSASEQLRRQRVQSRDGLSSTAIDDRIKRQYSQAYKDAHSDYVIANNEQHLLIPAVSALHEQWQATARPAS